MAKKVKEVKKAIEETTNAVSVEGTFSADAVPSLLEGARKTLATVKAKQEVVDITKGVSLPDFGKVSDLDDVRNIIEAVSAIENRAKCYNEVAERLSDGGEFPAFELEGHSLEDWTTDLTNQYARVTEVDMVRDLEEYISELEVFETKEQKLAKVAARGQDLIKKYAPKG